MINPVDQNFRPFNLLNTSEKECYTSEVITSLDAFFDLKKEWDELINRTPEKSLNLEHGWLYAWLKNFDSTCGFIILVRDDQNKLIGAAPFKISKPKAGLNRRMLRHLQFIGTEPCLYDEIKILMDSTRNIDMILKGISEEILKVSKKWDVIDLRYNPSESQLTQLLKLLEPSVEKAEITPTMTCPYFKLPENYETYEKEYPKNRKKRRRHTNQLNRDFGNKEIQLEWITDKGKIEEALDDLMQRHMIYWKARGVQSGFQRYNNMKHFYQDLFSQYPSEKIENETEQKEIKPGRIRFSALKMDGKVLSYDIGLQQKDGYLGHLGCYCESFKRYAPGFLHVEALIQNRIENGDGQFYFGRGNENHKSNWADKEQKLFNLLIFKNRLSRLQWQGDIWLKKLIQKRESKH